VAGDAFAAARDAVHDIVGFLEDDLWIWARGCTATVGQWHRFLRGWCSRVSAQCRWDNDIGFFVGGVRGVEALSGEVRWANGLQQYMSVVAYGCI